MRLKIFLIIQSSRVVSVLLPSWSNIIKKLCQHFSQQVYYTTTSHNTVLPPNHNNNNAITIRRKFHRPICVALSKLSKQLSGRTWRILRQYYQVGTQGSPPLNFSEECKSYSITRYMLHNYYTYLHTFSRAPLLYNFARPVRPMFLQKVIPDLQYQSYTQVQWTQNRRQFPPENITSKEIIFLSVDRKKNIISV